MEKQTIDFPQIELLWHEWVHWDDLKRDARSGGIKVPNKQSGVYEARFEGAEERLTIGRTSNLRYRIKQGLVRGKSSHSSGEKIREHEDTSMIVVRWAKTDRPAAVEEELHKQHKIRFEKLPVYVENT